jgi:hypothetical protein
MDEVVGLDLQRIRGLIRLGKMVGWWWPFDSVVVVTRKPNELHLDAEGRLHCENGIAVSYRDGWGLHAWHGIRVPAKVIENPDSITANDITGEANVEIRRAMLERVGYDRLLGSAVTRCFSKYGRLLEVPLDNEENIVLLEVENSTPEPDGSIKKYLLRVPPGTQTPKEAVAWTFDMGKNEYFPSQET